MPSDRHRRLAAAACCVAALLAGPHARAEENPTQVTFEAEATFAAPAGSEVRIAPGAYQVTASGQHLVLTPAAGGAQIVIAAEADRAAEPVAEPVAVYAPGEGEAAAERHLVLLLPDGSRREAIGAEGAVVARDAARLKLPAVTTAKLAGKKLASTGRKTKPFPFFKPGGKPATPPTEEPPAEAPSKQTTELPDLIPEALPHAGSNVVEGPSAKPGCPEASAAYLACTAPIALAGGCGVFDPNDPVPYHICVFHQDREGFVACIKASRICQKCGCRKAPPPGKKPGKVTACTWRTSDIIDTHIDVSAQVSLMRMMNRGGADRRDASAMISAVKSGEIEGIFRPGLKVTVDRGQRMTPPRPYWELLQGQPSACLLEPAGDPPIIVYRDKMPDAQTDQALRAAWSQCGLPTPDPPCDYVVNLTKPKPCEAAHATVKACVDRSGAKCTYPPSCKGDMSCAGTQQEQLEYVACMEAHDENLPGKCHEEARGADPVCIEESEKASQPKGGGGSNVPATGGV
jgi:hypothetical protein